MLFHFNIYEPPIMQYFASFRREQEPLTHILAVCNIVTTGEVLYVEWEQIYVDMILW